MTQDGLNLQACRKTYLYTEPILKLDSIIFILIQTTILSMFVLCLKHKFATNKNKARVKLPEAIKRLKLQLDLSLLKINNKIIYTC